MPKLRHLQLQFEQNPIFVIILALVDDLYIKVIPLLQTVISVDR